MASKKVQRARKGERKATFSTGHRKTIKAQNKGEYARNFGRGSLGRMASKRAETSKPKKGSGVISSWKRYAGQLVVPVRIGSRVYGRLENATGVLLKGGKPIPYHMIQTN